jgi:diphthamide synthase subunit DPH2
LRTANADSVERSFGACFIDDSSLSDSGITLAGDYTASEVKRSDQIVLGFARSRFLVSSFKLLRH